MTARNWATLAQTGGLCSPTWIANMVAMEADLLAIYPTATVRNWKAINQGGGFGSATCLALLKSLETDLAAGCATYTARNWQTLFLQKNAGDYFAQLMATVETDIASGAAGGGSFTDSFADASGPRNLSTYDSTHWGAFSGLGAFEEQTINSGGGCAASGSNGSSYLKTLNAADVEVYSTMVDAFSYKYLWARISDPTSGSFNAYVVKFGTSGSTIDVFPYVGGAAQAAIIQQAQAKSANDRVKLKCVGSTISVEYASGAGAFSQIASVTDTQVQAAGYVGLGASAGSRKQTAFTATAL